MDDSIPPVVPPPPTYAPSPPIIVPPGQPRVPRRGRGWMVIAIILLVLLGLSMLVNLCQFIGSALHGSLSANGEAGPRLDEAVIEDNKSAEKIAVVDVNGVITGETLDGRDYSMVDIIKAQLDLAQSDSSVKAVILKVDSPGGEVLASDEISEAIRNFEDGKKINGDEDNTLHAKPVIVSMGDLAASGGYYISAPCRWLVANKMTITGSIGVIMHGWNYRGLIDKLGIAPETYKSGKFKDMLSGSRETNEIPAEEHQMVQNLINEVYGQFKQVVGDGRNAAHTANSKCQPLAPDWTNYADGRVLSGTEAKRLGFVDQVGDFHDAVKAAESIADISDANLVRYEEHSDLSNLLHIFGQSKAQAPVVKVDLGFDAPKIQAGQMYFLSPLFFH